MALHDYECLAHGVFESMQGSPESPPPCPHGCGAGMVKRVFLKAPGIMSNRTVASDNALAAVAAQHNLTNMTNKGGDTSMLNAMAEGGVNTRSMPIDGGNMSAAISSLGAPSDGGAFRQIAPMLKKPTPIVQAAWKGS